MFQSVQIENKTLTERDENEFDGEAKGQIEGWTKRGRESGILVSSPK